MTHSIPVILCIDVEPDARRPEPGNGKPWRGFERLYPFLQKIRGRMADGSEHEVHLNWFWRADPQIEIVHGTAEWALRRYRSAIAEATFEGDEHGVHPHAWRWDSDVRAWVDDCGNPSWVAHCVIQSFTVFQSVFGKTCESVRMGDRYLDDRVRGTLERLGCRFDLTVEPGEKPFRSSAAVERCTGSIPDYQTMVMGPYRPLVEDFRKADAARSEGLWMIPLASGVMPEHGLKLRRYLRRRWSSSGAIPTGYGTLRLWEPPELVQPAIEQTLERMARPYLAFAIRSDVLVNPWWAGNCRRNLEWLAGCAQSKQLQFCTPREAIRLLDFPIGDPCPLASQGSSEKASS